MDKALKKYGPIFTIPTFAAIMVCRVYAPLLRMIVFAESRLVHGKSSIRDLKNPVVKLYHLSYW